VLAPSAETATAAGSVALLERTAVTVAGAGVSPSTPEGRPVASVVPVVESGFPRDLAVSVDEPEVVLPVPPMAESGENRRGRRWFRGSAA
jgi:hypothetical protein